VALAFVPVVGEAKMAAMLARSTGVAGRLGVRAAVGAAEGAVGAAVIEPLVYGLANKLGDDYTVYDSFMNVAVGSVLGAGLHTAVGGAIEVKNKMFPEVTPLQKISKQFDNMSAGERQNYIKAAVAQIVEDRPIDISPIDLAHKIDVKTKLDEIDLRIKQAQSLNDEASVSSLTRRYEVLKQQMDEVSVTRNEVPNVPDQAVTAEPKLIDKNYLQNNLPEGSNVLDEFSARVKQAVEKQDRILYKGDPIVEVKGNSLVLQNGNEIPFSKAVDDGVTLEGRSQNSEMKIQAEQQAVSDSRNFAKPSSDDVRKAVKNSISEPFAKYVDNTADQIQESTMADLSTRDVADTLEIAQRETDLVVQEAIDSAKASGVDIEAELKAADVLVKDVDDYTDFLRKVAQCGINKGSA